MMSSSADLLEGLLEELELHRKRYHEKEEVPVHHHHHGTKRGDELMFEKKLSVMSHSSGSSSGNDNSSNCKRLLVKVKHVLSSVFRHLFVPNLIADEELALENKPMLVLVLDLMRVLLVGSFCPHAKAVFGYGHVDSISPPFVKLVMLLLEPTILKIGIAEPILDNLRALLKLLTCADPISLCATLHDLVDILSLLEGEEVNGRSIEGFGRLGKGKVLKIDIANEHHRNHAQMVLVRLSTLFVKDFFVLFASLPSFGLYLNYIVRQLDRNLPYIENAKEDLVDEIIRASMTIMETSNETGNVCGVSSGELIRSALLQTAWSWSELEAGRQRPRDRHWAHLSQVLAACFASRAFDSRDAEMIVYTLKNFAQKEDLRGQGEVQLLKTLLDIYLHQMSQDESLECHLQILFRKHIVRHRSLHGSLSAILASGLQTTSKSSNQLIGEILHDVVHKENEDPNNNNNNGVGESPGPVAITAMVTSAKDASSLPRQRAFIGEATRDTLTWIITSAMEIKFDDDGDGPNGWFRRACLSLLVQMFAHISFGNAVRETDTRLKQFIKTIMGIVEICFRNVGEMDLTNQKNRNTKNPSLMMSPLEIFGVTIDLILGLICLMGNDAFTLSKLYHVAPLAHEVVAKYDDIDFDEVEGKTEVDDKNDSNGMAVVMKEMILFTGETAIPEKARIQKEVVVGQLAFLQALTFPLSERCAIVASNFPGDWLRDMTKKQAKNIDLMEKLCVSIIRSGLLSAVHRIRVRSLLQLPMLLTNLRIRLTALQKCCADLAARELTKDDVITQFSQASHASQARTSSDHGPLSILTSFLRKLGSWISFKHTEAGEVVRGDNAVEETIISAVHACSRISGLPLHYSEEEVNQFQSHNVDGNDGYFHCHCHYNKIPKYLGDVPGSLLLFKQWLHAVFAGKVIMNKQLAPSARVALIHCCASIFRRTVHIGASRGIETFLVDGRYEHMISDFLALLEDDEESVRLAVGSELSLFVEGCGGGVEYLRKEDHRNRNDGLFAPSKSQVTEDSPGRCDLLKAVFKQEGQTANVSAFMKKLRHYISNNQASVVLAATREVESSSQPKGVSPNNRNSAPILYSLLHAIGTIGCTADTSYLVHGVNVGSNLLCWSLLMLTRQYANAVARTNEIYKSYKKNNEQLSEMDRVMLSSQLNAAETLMSVVCAQFNRIANAHGFCSDGNQRVYELFNMVRHDLYTQLFVTLLTDPIIRKAPEALEKIVFDVFQIQKAGGQQRKAVGNQSKNNDGIIASGQTQERSGDKEDKTVLLARFVEDSLPHVLPDLLKDMNLPVLYEVAKRLYMEPVGSDDRASEEDQQQLVRTMIIDHYGAWSVDLIELLAFSQENDEPGYGVWKRIVEFAKFSLKEIFTLCRKTVLARVVFRLVEEQTGQPDSSAERILHLLARYTMQEHPIHGMVWHDDEAQQPAPGTEYQDTRKITSEIVKSLIISEFMYMMGELSEQIMDRWCPAVRRCHALRCATRLLELVGSKEVDVFLPKILPTLKSALQQRDPMIQLSACNMMYTFVGILSDNVLRSNISSLVVSLLPCLRSVDEVDSGTETKQVGKKARKIIEWFVNTKHDTLRATFADIYGLLPIDHPLLAKVKKILEQDVGAATLLGRLVHLTKLVQHESDNVRLLALEELYGVISQNLGNLHKILLDKTVHQSSRSLRLDENANDRKLTIVAAISKLVGVLLRLSRKAGSVGSTTQRVRIACAKCLGELGAIDPVRLKQDIVVKALSNEVSHFEHSIVSSSSSSNATGKKNSSNRLCLDVGNDTLVAIAIKDYLVDALRAAPDPNCHMQVGMAIQELLRFLRSKGFVLHPIELNSQESMASTNATNDTLSINKLLGSDIVEIISPFWDTNYGFIDKSEWLPPKPSARGGKSFFGPDVSFEVAVGDWFAHLSFHAYKGHEQSNIFKALRVLHSYSGATDLLLFLLPYLIQNVINHPDGKPYIEEIGKEIMGILRDTWYGESCPGDEDDIDENTMDTGEDEEDELGNNGKEKPTSSSLMGGRVHKNAHAMFALLDTLSTWDKQARIFTVKSNALQASSYTNTQGQNSRHASGTGSGSKMRYDGQFLDKTAINMLLAKIPMRCLAEAAYRCGANARALKYFEAHIRATHSRFDDGSGVAPGAWVNDAPIQLERDEITFLHRIYASLESERDGLRGVITLRSRHNGGPGTGYDLGKTNRTVSQWRSLNPEGDAPQSHEPKSARKQRKKNQQPRLEMPPGTQPGDGGQPTLMEEIYELEHAGRWDEAVNCYERILSEIRSKRDWNSTSMDTHDVKNESSLEQGLYSCFRRLGYMELLVSLGATTTSQGKQQQKKSVIRPFYQEALWKLGRWQELSENTENNAQIDPLLNYGPGNMGAIYTSSLAKAMSVLAKRKFNSDVEETSKMESRLREDFIGSIDKARLEVMDRLSAVSMESYIRAYPLLVRLQTLAELEGAWDVIGLAKLSTTKGGSSSSLSQSDQEERPSVTRLAVARERLRATISEKGWDNRFKITMPAVDLREELFEVRRAVYRLAGLEADEMLGWLSIAKTARIAGHSRGCLKALQCVQECAETILNRSLDAPSFIDSQFSKEKEEAEVALCKGKVYLAELYHQQYQHVSTGQGTFDHRGSGLHDALMVLEPVPVGEGELIRALKDANPSLKKARTKGFLLATNLMLECRLGTGDLIVKRYKDALKILPDWEDGFFSFAKYFDMLMRNLEKSEDEADEEYLRNASSGSTSRSGPDGSENLGPGSALKRRKKGSSSSGSSSPAGKSSTSHADLEMARASRAKESRAILHQALKFYCKSLIHGHKHLYESLPRLLTIWYSKTEELTPLLEYLERMRQKKQSNKNPARRGSSRHGNASEVIMASQNIRGGSKTSPVQGKDEPTDATTVDGCFLEMKKIIQNVAQQLPPYIWYTVVPQLVSRLGVTNSDVWAITKYILARIILAYPEQTGWHIIGVAQSKAAGSSSATRSERVQEIYRKCFGKNKVMMDRFEKQQKIFETLIKIAEKKTDRRQNTLDLSTFLDTEQTKELLSESSLCMPTQEELIATLPTRASMTNLDSPARSPRNKKRKSVSGSASVASMSSSSMDTDNCNIQLFGAQTVRIVGLGTNVTLMASKEKPKKIKILGSDGAQRHFLCKNENRGDLRKDSRMMEFNSVVNRLFQSDTRASKRKLKLRTYAVVCLNETCGLMEWMEGTLCLRHVITYSYLEEKPGVQVRELINKIRMSHTKLQDAETCRHLRKEEFVEQFRKVVLRPIPPITHKWFLNHFPEPENWLEARALFTRSAAAWSIVGHIIGLGDRHADNILVDSTTGECVHVDFDCIFDKGLTLARPEIVPFRLTRHMVDVMDLSGVDGAFKSTCEVALDVLRSNKDTLMSVLESFVVDPLVEWTRVKQNQNTRSDDGDSSRMRRVIMSESDRKKSAKNKLEAIREKLDGIVRDRIHESYTKVPVPSNLKLSTDLFDVLPLSTQGQVHKLIQEATNELSLALMFPGWAPFL